MTCDDLFPGSGQTACQGGAFFEPRCMRCHRYKTTGVPAGLDINHAQFARRLVRDGTFTDWPRDGSQPEHQSTLLTWLARHPLG